MWWLLLIVLGLVGRVEADEGWMIQSVRPCQDHSCTDPQFEIEIREPRMCLIGTDESISLSCVVRMREAMRSMDFVIRSAKVDELRPEIAGRYIRESETWRTTMAECVRGR